MTMAITRALLIWLGGWVCAYKGLVFLWNPIDPNGVDVSENHYGLTDRRLDPEFDRIGSGEPLTHVLTNVTVEYYEALGKSGLRRAVKLGCLYCAVSTICAFVLGAIIF